MNLAEFADGKAQQPLPNVFVDHEAELDKFQRYCHTLMLKILVLFAIGLEVTFPSLNFHFILMTIRLIPKPVAQIGSPLAIEVMDQAAALLDFFIIHRFHPAQITSHLWIFEQALTQITAL